MTENMEAALPMPLPIGTPAFSIGLSSLGTDPLTQSEGRFRALAQATGQIYWIADAHGQLIDVSSWCAFTGQTADEARGDGWGAVLHPDDREPTLTSWNTAIATRHPYRHEHRARRADGQYRLMLVQAYPVLDTEGAVREWVGVNTDITLLQELQADVQASQEEFQATFEQAAVGIAHVRLHDGRILRANQKFGEILGYPREEVLCHTFQDLTYSEDLDTNLVLFEQLLAGEISTYTLEKRYIRKDGSLVWVTLTGSLKRDRAGSPEYGIAVIGDISARKAAEEALRQSEQQYRQLFEAMAQGVIYFSTSGEILAANPAALRMVGLTQEEIQSRTAWDPRWQAIYEDGSPRPPETRPVARALRTGQPISDVVGFFNNQEQAYRWFQVTAIPEFQPGERAPYRVFATFEDITEQQRLEKELQIRVQELEAIFASMSEGLIVVGSDGKILRANPAYEALVGWSPDSAFFTMPPEERYRVLQIRDGQGQRIPPDEMPIAQVFQGEQVTMDQIFQSRDGCEVYASMRGAPLTDTTDHIIGAVLVFHDLTERRQFEQRTHAALQALLHMAEVLVQQPLEREEQHSPLVGQHLAELACSLLGCPVATIITLDPKTQEMQMLATVGYSSAQDDILHTMLSSWSHHASDLAHLERLMAGETLLLDVTESPYQEQAALFGSRQALVAPMRLGGRLMGMVVFNPGQFMQTFTEQQIALASATAQLVGLVVERERLFRQREEARASALAERETARQMSDFLSLIGHELRTPLTSLKGQVQLTQRQLTRLFSAQDALPGIVVDSPPTLLGLVEQMLERLRLPLWQLERLISDLVGAAQLQRGQFTLAVRPCDLTLVVKDTVEAQRAALPERAIDLQVPEGEGVIVCADATRVGQVVTNYLTNALKYSPQDSPIAIILSVEGGQAHLAVRDYGPGIPLEEQAQIWEQFRRGQGAGARSGAAGGLGLGLYLCKQLIERQGGQVGLESQPGAGSTFWFRLPLAAAPR